MYNKLSYKKVKANRENDYGTFGKVYREQTVRCDDHDNLWTAAATRTAEI